MRKLAISRAGFWVWLALWPIAAALTFWPISFGAGRALLVASAFFLWLGAWVLFNRYLGVKIVGILLAVLGAAIAFWPARPASKEQLRGLYLANLQKYRGTPYVWGGENARGIDCSGLIRRAWIDANLKAGTRDLNFSLWREAFSIWWRDCSAGEMKNGYGGRIVPLFAAPNLNQLDESQLQIGDLAVLQSGVHVLAFVGPKTWIQADPNLVNGGDQVILTKAPSKSGWFGQKVVICRWRALADQDFFTNAKTVFFPSFSASKQVFSSV